MTDTYLLRLGWPSKWLSQNRKDGSPGVRRAHYAAKKAARQEGWAEAKLRGVKAWPDARLVFAFHPPSRRFDIQNVPAMLKPHIDGIADAMGCDDKDFAVSWPERFSEPAKGGCVLIEIQPGDAEMIEHRGVVG